MPKSLLIVESPTKAKTLQKYLGPDIQVVSSKGHIKDLPKNELGVDLEHDFQPKYVTILGKAKVIQDLKKVAADIQEIFLGPDPDREGEAISWMVEEAVRVTGGKMPRVFYETGAVGKEPVSILVGKDPLEVAEQICELARSYRESGQGMR